MNHEDIINCSIDKDFVNTAAQLFEAFATVPIQPDESDVLKLNNDIESR